MMRKIAAVAIVAALVAVVSADAYALYPAKQVGTQGSWELSRDQTHLINMHQEVQMNIGLKRRNIDRMEKILLEVSDPASPKYGEHLNNDQIRALVSPGTKAVRAVQSWLAAAGAKKVELAVHEDSFKFVATRAQVAAMLNVQWAAYANAQTKQTAVRAMGETQIPQELAAVIEVIAGHRNFPMTPAPKPAAPKAGSPDVTPKLLYKIYDETDIPKTPAGKRNVQSFFQAQGQAVLASDLDKFCSTYIPKVNESCKISKYIGGVDASSPGVESSLDSQYIIATSMGAETWAYTYNGNDFCGDLLSWAQDVFAGEGGVHPNVISMSYGSQSLPMYCEGEGANRLSADTMKMGVAGISVIIASGDSGSAEYSRAGYNNGYLASSFPAELPYVTAVGSTTFLNGNAGTETAAYFSGGGFAANFTAPAYQSAQTAKFLATTDKKPTDKFSASGRGTPDVSFIGIGFNVINDGQTESVAGTSCSTPSFSGMVTLLNNIRLQQGKTLGFLNPLLYSNPDGFTDITSGNNDMRGDGQGWYAKAGWDPVTGLGTPKFDKLVSIVKAMNGPSTPAPPTPSNPPTPPTPGGSFTSKTCTSPDCSNCASKVEPQRTCIVKGEFSFVAVCDSDNQQLIIAEYAGTQCQGPYNTTSQAAGVCTVDFGAKGLTSYNEIVCGSGNGPMPPSPPAPGPFTPAPVAPTTPAPSSGGTFTQKICTNAACTAGCQSHSFPQDKCLTLTGGGSAKAKCSAKDLTLTEYPTSTTCTGFSIPTTQPINKCEKDTSGSYLENLCSSSLEVAAAAGKQFHTTAELAVKVQKLMGKRI